MILSDVLTSRIEEGRLRISPWPGGLVLGKKDAPVSVQAPGDPFADIVAQLEAYLGRTLPRLGKRVQAHGFEFSLQMHKRKRDLVIVPLPGHTAHERLSLMAAFGALSRAPAQYY